VFRITSNSSPTANTPGFEANAVISGNAFAKAYNTLSDRNAKERFRGIDVVKALEAVAGLPLRTWNFKGERKVRHLGPTAQDFYRAFGGLGGDDKRISTVDADGVALAAIQALYKQNRQLQRRVTRLERLLGRRQR
jgi:hypothetical protein